jgi:hypothetical protein
MNVAAIAGARRLGGRVVVFLFVLCTGATNGSGAIGAAGKLVRLAPGAAKPAPIWDNGSPGATFGGIQMTTQLLAEDFTIATRVQIDRVRFWSIEARGVTIYQGSIYWAVHPTTASNLPTMAPVANGLAVSPTKVATGRTWVTANYTFDEYQYDVPLPNVIVNPGTWWLALHHGPLSFVQIDQFSWQRSAVNTTFTTAVQNTVGNPWFASLGNHGAFQLYGGPVVSSSPVDFDGDGLTDWAVTRSGSLVWHVLNSLGYTGVSWGDESQDVPVPGDYDGDASTDIAVWRPSDGTFYVLRSSDGAFMAQPWGASGDDPRIVGDYDGDGADDFAVYRPGNPSVWWVKPSGAGGYFGIAFGQTGDKPAPGDYDGDGRADPAVVRGPGATMFYILQSTAGFTAVPWGLDTDAIEPGDYDGDRKTDIAIARQVNGTWAHYIRRSSNGSLYGQVWGLSTDTLTPGDYDGDGKTNLAVWRGTPAPSAFYVLQSSNGALIAQPWGLNGDYAVPFFIVH